MIYTTKTTCCRSLFTILIFFTLEIRVARNYFETLISVPFGMFLKSSEYIVTSHTLLLYFKILRITAKIKFMLHSQHLDCLIRFTAVWYLCKRLINTYLDIVQAGHATFYIKFVNERRFVSRIYEFTYV